MKYKVNEALKLFSAFIILYSAVTILSLIVLSVLPYLKIYVNNVILLPSSSISQIFHVVIQSAFIVGISMILFFNNTVISFMEKLIMSKPLVWAFHVILK